MEHARVSEAIMKRRANSGEPCLMPQINLNYFDVNPLLITQLKTPLYIVVTHLIIFGPKPQDIIDLFINSKFNLSNAFSKLRKAIEVF